MATLGKDGVVVCGASAATPVKVCWDLAWSLRQSHVGYKLPGSRRIYPRRSAI